MCHLPLVCSLVENAVHWFQINMFASLLIHLMIADVLTGLLRAWQERTLISCVAGAGMRRKATMLIMVLVGQALEPYMQHMPVSEIIAAGFAVSEGISVIENAAALGVPVPPILRQVFVDIAQRGPGLPAADEAPKDKA